MENREVRLIDANALAEKWRSVLESKSDEKETVAYYVFEIFIERLAYEPTIDPESLRPHGEWVVCSDGYYPYCSECKEEPKGGAMTNYCPNCGAVMQGVKDE